MKIIIALCLINLVACEMLPVIQSNRLTKKRTSTLIIKGEDANITDFPWQASLRGNGYHKCGAAVVSTRVAVTAAHCYDSYYKGKYTLKVGSSRLSGNEGTVIPVTNFTLHPDYIENSRGTGFLNKDIAILMFTTDIAGCSEKLATAAAIPGDDDDFRDASCNITGWGKTGGSVNDFPDILQSASTIVKSYDDCRKKWGTYIRESHVCVFTGFNGACSGDSGGPLTCGNVLVGVTSWGATGCQTTYPSVYTRISAYRAWINSFI